MHKHHRFGLAPLAFMVCVSASAQPVIRTAPEQATTPPAMATPAPMAQVRPQDNAPQPRTAAAEAPPNSRLGQQATGTPVPVAMPATTRSIFDAPRVVYPPPNEVVERAVREMEDMQLTPDQYERLKNIFIERSQQRASPYVTPPKPVTRTLMVNLDPGVSPPVLRLTRGQQTSIVFSDVSGQPWLIEKVSLNRQMFSDGRTAQAVVASGQGTGQGQVAQGEAPTNVLTIEALQPAAYGNVTVTLRGQSTPVIFILTAAQQEADMRVDAKVPGTNPDATHEVTLNSAPNIDRALPYFLDGVPPQTAKRLRVTGLDAEAWVYEQSLYVKARANAQYPAYMAAARSTSGISVYRYHGVPKAATFTTGGRALTAFFE